MKKVKETEEMKRFRRGEYDDAGSDWPSVIFDGDDYWKYLEKRLEEKDKNE